MQWREDYHFIKISAGLIITYFRLKCNNLFQVMGYFSGVMGMYPRIRDLREDADLNQTKVAQYLGMSQTGYSKYETGENDIPTQVLIKLAALYHVSTDYLLGISDRR